MVAWGGDNAPSQSKRCVTCGETFVPVGATQAEERWVLRRTNGEELQFDSLLTLQEWVGAGDASPLDEISKTGQAWRKLQDIVELAPLFQGVSKSPALPTVPTKSAPELAPLSASLEASGQLKAHKKTTRRSILVFFFALAAGAAVVVAVHYVQQQHNRQISRAQIYVDDARRQLMQNTEHHIQSSVLAFREATQVAPDYAPAQAWLALALIARADGLRLDAWLGQQEIQWDPGNVALDEARQERLILEADQRLEEAFLIATRGAALAADSVEANFVLADYYFRQGKTHDFRRHLTRIKIIDPNHPSRYYFEAQSQEKSVHAQVVAWEQLLIRGPSQNRMRLKMVQFLLGQEDFGRALQEINVVLNKAPAHKLAARLRGHIVRLQAQELAPAETPAADVTRAEEAPSVALKSGAPKFPKPVVVTEKRKLSPTQAMLRKADKLRAKGEIDEAAAIYRELLQQSPQHLDARTGLGFCYLSAGSLPAAFAAFEKVLTRASDYSEAHRGLAELWRARGNKEKALTHYRRYLMVLPRGSHAAQVRSAMMELENQP